MAVSYFWTLLVSSMGRPMSRPFRLNSGLKYSSAVMAVGLWGLAHWDTLLWQRNAKSNKQNDDTPCGRKRKAKPYPVVSCMLFSNPQERLQRSLRAWEETKIWFSKSAVFCIDIMFAYNSTTKTLCVFVFTFAPWLVLVWQMFCPCPSHQLHIGGTVHLNRIIQGYMGTLSAIFFLTTQNDCTALMLLESALLIHYKTLH